MDGENQANLFVIGQKIAVDQTGLFVYPAGVDLLGGGWRRKTIQGGRRHRTARSRERLALKYQHAQQTFGAAGMVFVQQVLVVDLLFLSCHYAPFIMLKCSIRPRSNQAPWRNCSSLYSIILSFQKILAVTSINDKSGILSMKKHTNNSVLNRGNLTRFKSHNRKKLYFRFRKKVFCR